MTPDRVRERLYAEKVIVVLRERTEALCLDKARALAEGGLSALEVTYTTPGATAVIAAIAKAGPGVVGAGSILEVGQAEAATAAGAQFLVSPVHVPAVAHWAAEHQVLYSSGALTPQEIWDAWEAGSRPVKVFPVSDLGGPSYIRHVLAPLPHLELCPTGGVTTDNFVAYLEAGARVVGIGDALTHAPEVSIGGMRALSWMAAIVRNLSQGDHKT